MVFCFLFLPFLQEARSTLAYMRKTQNFMTSRGSAPLAEPISAAVALSPTSSGKDELNDSVTAPAVFASTQVRARGVNVCVNRVADLFALVCPELAENRPRAAFVGQPC